MRQHAVLAVAVAVSVLGVLSQSPIPQDPTYHLMADRRDLFGISNGLNVLSNLPFMIAGAMGFAAVFSRETGRTAFRDRWRRWPYAALFIGVALTAFGSAYYHLAPDNARLVWDRLPVTVGFMGLLTAVLAERVCVRLARVLLIPLLVIGAGSVGYWYLTEVGGAGDLRFYGLVQFGTLLVVALLLLLYPAREPGTKYLVAGLAAYAAAKCFEMADAQILALGQIVSGHTLKHISAAVGVGCIVRMIRVRARSGSTIDQSGTWHQSPGGRIPVECPPQSARQPVAQYPRVPRGGCSSLRRPSSAITSFCFTAI